jgi:hypothetical protein
MPHGKLKPGKRIERNFLKAGSQTGSYFYTTLASSTHPVQMLPFAAAPRRKGDRHVNIPTSDLATTKVNSPTFPSGGLRNFESSKTAELWKLF